MATLIYDFFTIDFVELLFLLLQNQRNSNNPSPEMEKAILRTLTAAKSLNKQVILFLGLTNKIPEILNIIY